MDKWVYYQASDQSLIVGILSNSVLYTTLEIKASVLKIAKRTIPFCFKQGPLH